MRTQRFAVPKDTRDMDVTALQRHRLWVKHHSPYTEVESAVIIDSACSPGGWLPHAIRPQLACRSPEQGTGIAQK